VVPGLCKAARALASSVLACRPALVSGHVAMGGRRDLTGDII